MQEGAGGGDGGIHVLLSILADCEEQARQLGELPDDPRLGAEHYRGGARNLQCTLGKAVSVAKAMEAASRGATDSPRSADEGYGGTEEQERPGVCKRRKGLPRWTAKFRVPDASLEATPDDGFSWRKYGQKDILGAKFPRGYYRCTYRAAQSCPATKQVQRSDTDLCIFDVTYQGAHTCHQKQRHAAGAASPHDIGQPPAAPPQQKDPSMELLAGFKKCLKVETTDAALHTSSHDYVSASPSAAPFSFHAGVAPADEAVAAVCFSSSPAGSSYYAVPHCLVPGSYDDYSYGGMRGAESELGEVVSKAIAPAAAADLSAAAGFDYALYHHGEFDPHLPFAPSGSGHPHH